MVWCWILYDITNHTTGVRSKVPILLWVSNIYTWHGCVRKNLSYNRIFSRILSYNFNSVENFLIHHENFLLIKSFLVKSNQRYWFYLFFISKLLSPMEIHMFYQISWSVSPVQNYIEKTSYRFPIIIRSICSLAGQRCGFCMVILPFL